MIVPLEARFLIKGLFSAMALCTEADMLIDREALVAGTFFWQAQRNR